MQIMLQQFRQAIGLAIIMGNAKHKLTHLHYILAQGQRRQRLVRDTTVIISGGLEGMVGKMVLTIPLNLNSFEIGMTSVFLDRPQGYLIFILHTLKYV